MQQITKGTAHQHLSVVISEQTMLRGWRALAFAGHYSRVEALTDDGLNKVLRYHAVGSGFYDDIDPERLRRDVEYLDAHYELVDLPEVLESSDQKRIALTFDDGYRDFYRNVVPILREYEVPATVFVIADAVEDRSYSHTEQFDCEYMTREELDELVDEELVTVGNHTRSHPRLGELPHEDLEDEIAGAQRRLESLLDTDIRRFCYPYGSFGDRAVELVGETHDFGVFGRGRREPITQSTDPAAIPRINGANPFWEVRWDLSDTATAVGMTLDRFV